MKTPASQSIAPHHNPPPTGMGLYTGRGHQSSIMFWCLVAFVVHVVFILLAWLIITILQFFGWNIPLFNTAVKPRDVEFVLVDNTPREKPRNPTRNRAAHATRSGGKKIANMPTQISQRAAGRPAPKSVPRPSAQPQPQARPTPQPSRQATHQPAARPAPQPQSKAAPTPTPAPAPPAPRAPRPTKVANASPSLPPNPIAPTIRTPAPPNPSVSGGGPVAKTPGSGAAGGSGSSGGGRPGPSMIAGNPTRGGGGGSPGGGPRGGGSRGTGSYNQNGSPGGGGGRDGIDAQEEPDFGPYIAELQRRIRRNWSPPVEDRSKRVIVLFRISRDGRLISPLIQQSSGSPSADQAAIAAVRASAPFRTLPPAFRGNEIPVQFIFDYEIQGHGNASMR